MKYAYILYVLFLTPTCFGQYNVGEECILIDGPFKNKKVIIKEQRVINADTIKDDKIYTILLARIGTLTPGTQRIVTNHLRDLKISPNNRLALFQTIPDTLTKQPVYKVMLLPDAKHEIIVDICALQAIKASPQ